jgi:hypothetical protein
MSHVHGCSVTGRGWSTRPSPGRRTRRRRQATITSGCACARRSCTTASTPPNPCSASTLNDQKRSLNDAGWVVAGTGDGEPGITKLSQQAAAGPRLTSDRHAAIRTPAWPCPEDPWQRARAEPDCVLRQALRQLAGSSVGITESGEGNWLAPASTGSAVSTSCDSVMRLTSASIRFSHCCNGSGYAS